MNLLIADFFQGLSFTISFHWITVDGILAPSNACFAQGFLLNLGDISSGLFVFYIALHTFFTAVKGRRIPQTLFASMVVFIWLFCLLLTAIGPIQHKRDYFVKAGAWCWASSEYERDRLALHYIWIFMVQFGTVIIYVLVLLHLKKTMALILPTAAQSSTYHKVDRAAQFMVLYPLTYIILTLPLSAGRMWSMAHNSANLPNKYSLTAGALIAASGFVDSLLYTLTRRALLKSSTPDGPANNGSGGNSRAASGWFKNGGSRSGGSKSGGAGGTLTSQSSWVQPDGGITQTKTVTVIGQKAHDLKFDSDSTEEYEFSSHYPRHPKNTAMARGVPPMVQPHQQRNAPSMAMQAPRATQRIGSLTPNPYHDFDRMHATRHHERSGSADPIIPASFPPQTSLPAQPQRFHSDDTGLEFGRDGVSEDGDDFDSSGHKKSSVSSSSSSGGRMDSHRTKAGIMFSSSIETRSLESDELGFEPVDHHHHHAGLALGYGHDDERDDVQDFSRRAKRSESMRKLWTGR